MNKYYNYIIKIKGLDELTSFALDFYLVFFYDVYQLGFTSISSLFNDISLFSKAIRNHWGVENKLHWQLDYTFQSDKNTTMNKNALMNLQLIKKLSLGILKNAQDVYSTSLSGIRNKLAINFEVEILRLLNIITK